MVLDLKNCKDIIDKLVHILFSPLDHFEFILHFLFILI